MDIQTCILSTTHIDKQNERMAKSALDGMAEQINEKYIPQLIEHDWNRGIKGVVLYAEVFQLTDGEYALGGVIGIFTNNKDKEDYVIGSENTTVGRYKSFLDKKQLINLVDNNKESNDLQIKEKGEHLGFGEQLKKYLNSTNVTPDGRVYCTKGYIGGFGSTSIVLYPKDHDNPAHFHVISKQHNLNARFDLETYDFISTKHGKITNKLKKQVKKFLLDNSEVAEKLKSEYLRMR